MSVARVLQGGLVAILMVTMHLPSIQAKAALPWVYDNLKTSPNHKIMTYALTVVGTVSSFPGDLSTQTTLLAPTDKAFAEAIRKLGITIAQLKANKPLLTRLVAYHTIPEISVSTIIDIAKNETSTLPDTDIWIPTATDWDTSNILNGQTSPNNLRLFFRNEKLTFRGFASAARGTLSTKANYVSLDAVLLPKFGPYANCKTVAQILLADKSFSSLVKAMKTANKWDAVSKPGFSGTVFAPNNKAFETIAAKLEIPVEVILRTKSLLEPLVSYHTASKRVYRSNLYQGLKISTLSGLDLLVDTKSGSFKIIGGESTAILKPAPAGFDVWACKAVVHPLGTVLLP